MAHDRSWAAGIATAAAGAGHDLGNVLTAIYGHAELARELVPPGHAAQEELEELLARAEQAHDLARRLSLLGRAGLPAFRLDDLAGLLAELVAARSARPGAVVPVLDLADPERAAPVLAPPTLSEALDLLLDQEPADAPAEAVRMRVEDTAAGVRLLIAGPGPPPPGGEHEIWYGGILGLAMTVLQVGALTVGGAFRAGPGPAGGRVVELELPAAGS